MARIRLADSQASAARQHLERARRLGYAPA